MTTVLRLRSDRIRGTIVPEPSRFTSPEVDEFWKRYQVQVGRTSLYDGTMFELVGHEIGADELSLQFRKTRYAEFIYARSTSQRFQICHPATCFYKDESTVLLVKMAKNTQRAGLWSFPGGVLDELDQFDGALDIRNCAIRENGEELGSHTIDCVLDQDAVAVRTQDDRRISIVYFSRINDWNDFLVCCALNKNVLEIDDIAEGIRPLGNQFGANLNEYIEPALDEYFG